MGAAKQSVKEVPDRRLVEKARQGDTAAYAELVRRYERRAYGVAYGMLRNPSDAQDVAQDAFIKAYRYLGRFKGTASFYTWLYRIVVNLCIDHLRKRSRSAQVEYDDRLGRPDNETEPGADLKPSTLDSNPQKALARRELAEAMQKGLDTLSEKHRAVLVLRELEGLSYKEMAEVMKCSKGTIMSRLFHARKKMQEFLREYLGGKDLSIW
jgi:RNA polymerase sigma-70 factor (ECF subfamily)